MPKAPLRSLLHLTFFLCVVGLPGKGKAQGAPGSQQSLIAYLQALETEYDIKFSYADEDIRDILITVPEARSLPDRLTLLQDQAQVRIERLNQRYYAVTKDATVDICAIVLDNFEKNTVSGATVTILDSDTAVVTDGEGGFAFQDVPRNARLEIRHIGFKTLFVDAGELVGQNPCKTLLLAQFYQPLEEVVVYQFLTPGLIKQSDASIQLNTADFGILPGQIEPDILQTVQAVPGINSIDETVSDINIRGGTNDQNLLLWDGIKMYQSGHFFGLISAFNPYLTEKVSLIKNGTPARYGDGVSGVIDMRTKNEVGETFTGGAGVNLIGGDLFGHLPLTRKLAVQFSARRSMTDFLNTPTYNEFVDRVFQDTQVSADSDFYFYDFTGKILYDLNENQRLRLSFININNLLDYTASMSDGTSSSQSSLDQDNISFGGSLESTWGERFSSELNLYYSRYNLDALSRSTDGQQQLFQNNRVLETSVKLHTDYRIKERLHWLNGYQFVETGITNATNVTQPPFASDIKGVLHTHALFSELQYESTPRRWFARGGIRVNRIENLDSFYEYTVEPRLNVRYMPLRYFNIAMLGEYKSQATNQVIDLEQNFFGIEKRRWTLSDGAELPLTKSRQGSFGINYDHPRFYVGVEGFYKEVEGISTRTQGFQNPDQFNGEIGAYDVKGVEFLVNKKTDFYSAWLGYTYNFNNYNFPDIDPSEFPNNLDIRHTATFAGTYTYRNLKLGVGINYRTGRPFTEPDPNDPIDTEFFPNRIRFNPPNSSRLPEYWRADASAVYEFILGGNLHGSLGASVLNFTNRRNRLNTYYRLDENNEIETLESISLGITPNVSFRVWF